MSPVTFCACGMADPKEGHKHFPPPPAPQRLKPDIDTRVTPLDKVHHCQMCDQTRVLESRHD